MLLSRASDNIAKTTLLRCDADADSCWRQCCQVMLETVLQLKVVHVLVRLRNPRSHSIEVFSHHEEIRYSC
jgi:hypothetical protein